MENRESVLGATSIIGGTLLQISRLMMGNWLGFLAAIIGFYLIFSGMGKLQAGFDSAGRSALGMLRLGMIVMLVGLMLTLPTAITFLVTVLGIVLIHIQVRLEEPFLLEQYGDDYREYQKQVRRWL